MFNSHFCVLHYKTCLILLRLNTKMPSQPNLYCPVDLSKQEIHAVYGFGLRCFLIGHFAEDLYDTGLLRGERPPSKSIKRQRKSDRESKKRKQSKRAGESRVKLG